MADIEVIYCEKLDCEYCNWTKKINNFGECRLEIVNIAEDLKCKNYEKENSDE